MGGLPVQEGRVQPPEGKWLMSLRLRPWTVLSLVALVALGAVLAVALSRRASDYPTDLPSGEELFAVPVESSVALEIADFQGRLQEARQAGEAWTRGPLPIALEYLGNLEGRAVGLVKEDDRSEAPRRSTVTVIREGLLDDSVRAVWNQLRMERGENRAWELMEVREAYRCWRGDHQDAFSGELCP